MFAVRLPCRCGVRRGACPVGRRLTLPCRCPAGWLALFAVRLPCHCDVRRGGLPSMSPAHPAFTFFSAPIPPTPFPAGRGRPKVYFAGGFAPGTPALNRLRHWLSLPRGRGPSQTPPSLATDSSISPGPPSPWLPALPPVNKQKPLVVQVPRPAQPWGCKGRSPLHKKTLILPLPRRGRGLGGYPSPSGKGGKSKAKGRADRRQRRQAPRRVPGAAWSAGGYPGKPPAGYRQRPPSQCRAPPSLGDARGEAPCIKTT